jgi:Asp-tRNA(Asn)/Glu-tRNA(Gln) amidotransferase A subunit family amidase
MASIGRDDEDSATLARPLDTIGTDYAAELGQQSISGLRIGVLEGLRSKVESAETTPIDGAIQEVIKQFESAGAKVIAINDAVYDAANILATLDTQRFEYRENLDEYLARANLEGDRPKDFHELYSSNKFLVIPGQHEYVKTASTRDTTDSHYKVVQKGIAQLIQTLHNTFDKLELDAIVYPQQKCLPVKIGAPSQAQRNGILAALTGFPSVCVPAGFSPATVYAPIGVPIGMEILGRPWSEKNLLEIAYQLESITRVRRPPILVIGKSESVVELPIDWAKLRPDSQTHEAYPQGVLS